MRLKESVRSNEKLMERMILAEPTILSESWLLIGNQVRTNHGGFIDLLALDENQSSISQVFSQAMPFKRWSLFGDDP